MKLHGFGLVAALLAGAILVLALSDARETAGGDPPVAPQPSLVQPTTPVSGAGETTDRTEAGRAATGERGDLPVNLSPPTSHREGVVFIGGQRPEPLVALGVPASILGRKTQDAKIRLRGDTPPPHSEQEVTETPGLLEGERMAPRANFPVETPALTLARISSSALDAQHGRQLPANDLQASAQRSQHAAPPEAQRPPLGALRVVGVEAGDVARESDERDVERVAPLFHPFPASQWGRAALVSWCESRWKAKAQNLTSTAAGWFQIIRETWEWARENGATRMSFEEGRYDRDENIRVAAWLVSDGGGWDHWDASRVGCWGG